MKLPDIPNIEHSEKTYHPKDFEKKRYLADLKVLAPLKEERIKQYGMLVFTIIALSFFGLFAINPTIATIVELRKKLADSELVNTQLEKKLLAMSSLQEQYSTIQPDLPAIYAAIPEDPETVRLLGQLQEIAKEQNVTITKLESLPVALKNDPKAPKKITESKDTAVSFSIETTGEYENLQSFLSALTAFERIVSITHITISRDSGDAEGTRSMIIEGRGYYQHGV